MRLLQSPSAAALPPCNFLLTPKQPFPAALTPISALPSTNPSPFNTWDCPQLLPEPSPASPGSSRLPKLALGTHQVALISPALSVHVSIVHTLLPRCASLLVKPTFAFPILCPCTCCQPLPRALLMTCQPIPTCISPAYPPRMNRAEPLMRAACWSPGLLFIAWRKYLFALPSLIMLD